MNMGAKKCLIKTQRRIKDQRRDLKKSLENGVANGNRIIVDIETGVHYLFSWSGYAGGITPLLDKDGKPIIKPNNE
ncbi:hypothetical protein ABH966_005155 [Lysinibacillus sp. RC46]|uniref:DUF6440 family protein n=1 Tax=Lysinibacillus sp. RC46 TaxID=3156295 RepID=UPI003514E16C